MVFEKFDPLESKYKGHEEVVIKALKREVLNILNSYVGWFDPFCELIQNGLDAIDARIALNETDYKPLLKIRINIQDNYIVVTDNGIGFEEEQYKKFLAPNFSFKSGNTRGHKGVGATYLAYGFNYMQIATKSPSFEAIGVIRNARKWLSDENPASNPYVEPERVAICEKDFLATDRGTSACVKFDQQTVPKNLNWIQIRTADNWLKILRVKTALGAIKETDGVRVTVEVIDKEGVQSVQSVDGLKYLWINEEVDKCENLTTIVVELDKLFRKHGKSFRLPSSLSNLKAVYDLWTTEKLCSEIRFDAEEKEFIDNFKPSVYFCYVYSTNIWKAINEKVGIRSGQNVLTGGIQIGSDNMPQGELIQIPLSKNIGRQNQAHFYIHYENCTSDLGRKGFQKEISDFAKEISRRIVEYVSKKAGECFKRNTGEAPDLLREQELDDWKTMMIQHEKSNPLELINENFFFPTKQISITSIPTREQDVIALFNQLVAGGVIRGIRIMSTNERSTYDSLYKISIQPPEENHIFDSITNPLGVCKENITEILEKYPDGFSSKPKVLEYKYSLDGLIEDISSGLKNTNDIGLIVAWKAGDMYKQKFFINSLLIDEGMNQRQFHGATHTLHDYSTQERVCEMILLQDLILYLNEPEKCLEIQRIYEE